MPAIGDLPPFLTFVAVRAMAPVTGKPPKRGVIIFAAPWAISSIFDLCRLPIMPSATTAESSASIAPSRAMVVAGMMSCRIVAKSKKGSDGGGIIDGISPNRDSIVAT